MSGNASPLVLRNFSGSPEITPEAFALRKLALERSIPIKKVETEQEQFLAVMILRDLKAIRNGMETTRKSVKAPVLELGKKIDAIAADFLQEIDREEMRLQGHINHHQKTQLRLKREEEEKVIRDQAEAERLKLEAEKLREEAQRTSDPALKEQASELEAVALDKTLSSELSASITISKPKGLVVRERLNFQIEDAIIFCQAYPQFFSWNPETETLKLKRREILEELNKPDAKGIFHLAQFPEELPDEKGSRIAKPPGMRIFEDLRSHVR
jgi:hypothetical protein